VTVKTYDPGQIVIAVGAAIASGFSEDSVVEVARDEQSFTKHVGADGEATRSRNRNKGGTIKIKLMRTSSFNDVLAAKLAQDEATGTGVFPVTVKDLNGTTLHFSDAAWVQKPADDSFEAEVNDREWVLDCGDLEMFPGGSVVTPSTP
jgi:hypothetical protein